MELTHRLKKIADWVDQDAVIADIGTDHGYIPIYLVKNGRVGKAYAMDINKGPLRKAQENIKKFGFTEQIHTILSDGLVALEDKEVDTAVIAGMGGMLICKILEEGYKQLSHIQKLILSPHIDVPAVRKQVHQLGFQIVMEEMLLDDLKYYHILVCSKGSEQYEHPIDYEYGKVLIKQKDPIFKSYVEKKLSTVEKILLEMEGNDRCSVIERKEVLQKEAKVLREVLKALCE